VRATLFVQTVATGPDGPMIHTTKTASHWNYFLAIERDLDVLSRYVEFHGDNFKCYSLEIARILLAAGAEADVVCKLLYQPGGSRSDGIDAHRRHVTEAFPALPTFGVLMPQFGMALTPWLNWKFEKVPDWWTAYNKIKHQRDSHYHEANLFNAINATAALFVVVLYLYRAKAEVGELLPNPQLLRVADAHVTGMNGETRAPYITLK
jgi:hypothetical protein